MHNEEKIIPEEKGIIPVTPREISVSEIDATNLAAYWYAAFLQALRTRKTFNFFRRESLRNAGTSYGVYLGVIAEFNDRLPEELWMRMFGFLAHTNFIYCPISGRKMRMPVYIGDPRFAPIIYDQDSLIAVKDVPPLQSLALTEANSIEHLVPVYLFCNDPQIFVNTWGNGRNNNLNVAVVKRDLFSLTTRNTPQILIDKLLIDIPLEIIIEQPRSKLWDCLIGLVSIFIAGFSYADMLIFNELRSKFTLNFFYSVSRMLLETWINFSALSYLQRNFTGIWHQPRYRVELVVGGMVMILINLFYASFFVYKLTDLVSTMLSSVMMSVASACMVDIFCRERRLEKNSTSHTQFSLAVNILFTGNALLSLAYEVYAPHRWMQLYETIVSAFNNVMLFAFYAVAARDSSQDMAIIAGYIKGPRQQWRRQELLSQTNVSETNGVFLARNGLAITASICSMALYMYFDANTLYALSVSMMLLNKAALIKKFSLANSPYRFLPAMPEPPAPPVAIQENSHEDNAVVEEHHINVPSGDNAVVEELHIDIPSDDNAAQQPEEDSSQADNDLSIPLLRMNP